MRRGLHVQEEAAHSSPACCGTHSDSCYKTESWLKNDTLTLAQASPHPSTSPPPSVLPSSLPSFLFPRFFFLSD